MAPARPRGPTRPAPAAAAQAHPAAAWRGAGRDPTADSACLPAHRPIGAGRPHSRLHGCSLASSRCSAGRRPLLLVLRAQEGGRWAGQPQAPPLRFKAAARRKGGVSSGSAPLCRLAVAGRAGQKVGGACGVTAPRWRPSPAHRLQAAVTHAFSSPEAPLAAVPHRVRDSWLFAVTSRGPGNPRAVTATACHPRGRSSAKSMDLMIPAEFLKQRLALLQGPCCVHDPSLGPSLLCSGRSSQAVRPAC
ncbi:Dna-Dependent Protein Kinase Catalytic Subunit [Manis pentadactyla]|nr:Dna-Dependent Protein Kinase Catalytic Subunit [Manis pentadactyla]